jgi:hypothetical protein
LITYPAILLSSLAKWVSLKTKTKSNLLNNASYIPIFLAILIPPKKLEYIKLAAASTAHLAFS